jgi:hypothetical protein
MTTKSGKLRNNESFCGMIENLGDAYEAAEECYGMIWWLASEMARETMTPFPERDDVLVMIREAEAHYKDGLALGGVQRSR